MQKFRPLADRILVRPDSAAPQPTVGLIMPESQKEKQPTGIVVAVGPAAQFETDDGTYVFEPGEHVQFAKHSGRELTVNGEKMLLLRLEEIDGIWEDES